jgi:hypothetical protein
VLDKERESRLAFEEQMLATVDRETKKLMRLIGM